MNLVRAVVDVLRRGCAGICAAVAVVGCTGDGGDTISANQLRTLVLQPSDLQRGFLRYDVGPLTVTDIRPGPREDQSRFGRRGGWKARYRRPGTLATRGPLLIESRADAFDDGDGAERDLRAYREQFDREIKRAQASAAIVPTTQVGEGSWAMTRLQRTGLSTVRYYTIAWRQQNVTASLAVSGFERKFTLREALALVRKQQRRIERAE